MVAESDHLFADVLSFALDSAGIQVLGSVSSLAEAIAKVAVRQPTHLIVGFSDMDRAAIPLGREVSARWPSVKLLALLDDDSPEAARLLSRAGYCGSLWKGRSPDVIMRAIRAASRGEPIPDAIPVVGSGTAADSLFEQLTPRELEVLEFLADGAGSGEIARRLRIKTNTVRTHVQHILIKLHVNSRLEAVSLAGQPGGPLASPRPAQGRRAVPGAG